MARVTTEKGPIQLDMADFLENGILREKIFREKLASINWEQYRNKKVIIRGCDNIPIPIWAYMAIAAHLSQYARTILWGEPCSAVPVFTRLNQS